MIATASIAKHPLHPMLIPLPIGLWLFSMAADILMAVTHDPVWSTMAYYSMVGGIIGALLAALPAFVDLFTLNPSFVKRLGMWHMGLNLIIVLLYAVNVIWRRSGDPGAAGPFTLSVVAVLLLGVSGWLGGELVYVHGLAVEPVGRQKL